MNISLLLQALPPNAAGSVRITKKRKREMIHIITGPPCSGKSTYIRKNAKAGDLVIDYDLIAAALGANTDHEAEGLVRQAAFDARNAAIAAALKIPYAESWIIHTAPTEQHMRTYKRAGAEFILLDPGYEECMLRAARDGRPGKTSEGIKKWYSTRRTKLFRSNPLFTYIDADTNKLFYL